MREIILEENYRYNDDITETIIFASDKKIEDSNEIAVVYNYLTGIATLHSYKEDHIGPHFYYVNLFDLDKKYSAKTVLKMYFKGTYSSIQIAEEEPDYQIDQEAIWEE